MIGDENNGSRPLFYYLAQFTQALISNWALFGGGFYSRKCDSNDWNSSVLYWLQNNYSYNITNITQER